MQNKQNFLPCGNTFWKEQWSIFLRCHHQILDGFSAKLFSLNNSLPQIYFWDESKQFFLFCQIEEDPYSRGLSIKGSLSNYWVSENSDMQAFLFFLRWKKSSALAYEWIHYVASRMIFQKAICGSSFTYPTIVKNFLWQHLHIPARMSKWVSVLLLTDGSFFTFPFKKGTFPFLPHCERRHDTRVEGVEGTWMIILFFHNIY